MINQCYNKNVTKRTILMFRCKFFSRVYCDYNTSFDIIGDDEQLLYTVDIVGGSIPKEIKVDIHGTSQFKLRPKYDKNLNTSFYTYIVDATIE